LNDAQQNKERADAEATHSFHGESYRKKGFWRSTEIEQ